MKVTRAIVLAAGLGTRMAPLNLCRPKPMMPMWDEPLLGRILDLLESWGVHEILVNLHHLPELIVSYLRERAARGGPRLCMSYEHEIAGTGGALRRAAWFVPDLPFWVVNSDIVADLDPTVLVREYKRHKPLSVLWLHPALGPRTVEMCDGIIRNFVSARPGSSGTYTFCGLHLVAPAIARYVPEQAGPCSIIDVYCRAMRGGRTIRGVCVKNSFWADAGTPAQYLDAHARWLHAARRKRTQAGRPPAQAADHARGAHVRGWTAVETQAAIAQGAVLERSVVWRGARIGRRARLVHAVVADGVCATGELRGVAVPAELGGAPCIARALRLLGWAGTEVVVDHLAERGSDRTFTRLCRAAASVVLIRYTAARRENRRYAGHARFLRRIGVPVPRVLHDAPRARFVVVEDLGNERLQDRIPGMRRKDLLRLYGSVLRTVAVLHTDGTRAARRRRLGMEPAFGRRLYGWEQDLFREQFLERWLGLRSREIRALRTELDGVARPLEKLPHVLLHRDLQSSNILLVGGRPVFVDFQGMRLGPAAYDLASLLCDPYVSLPECVQERLLTEYTRCVGGAREVGYEAFWRAAVQRLVQALGAFARLGLRPGTGRFACHIGPALRMLARACEHVGGLPRLQRLSETAEHARPAADCAFLEYDQECGN